MSGGRTTAGPERVGVFGGTFDPPHLGHALVAADLVEGLDLDRLLVTPAPRPPHRSALFPAQTRLELTRRMFADNAAIVVDDIEYRREGPSYAIDTLRELGGRESGAELLLVIGADQLAAIDTWHEFRRIPELATIAVMRRDGREPRLPDAVADLPYITIDVTRIDLSASRIRTRLESGRSIRFMVPESIRTDIERAWDDLVRAQPVST